MKTDEELIEELAQAADGLLFMSESDYPFAVVRWEAEEITDAFLRAQAGSAPGTPVQSQTVDDFFRAATSEPGWKGKEELALAGRYQALVRLLKENLTDLRVYRVGEISIQVYITGRSPSRHWLGLATRVVET